MAICNLCGEDKDLIKKSHIYPNFVYSDLFDEHNKLRKFSVSEMLKDNPRISRPASGIYEGGLLCNECDNGRISKLESYIARVLNKNDKRVDCNLITLPDGLMVKKIKFLKYMYFKNFILSLLFRADISTFDEFKDVDLGPYKEKLRDVIFNGLETSDLDYQINIFQLSDDSNFNTIIGQPVRSKINSHTIYSILMKGFLIVISLKQNGTSRKVIEMRLKKEGTMNY